MQYKKTKQINYPSCVYKDSIKCDCVNTGLTFNNEPVKARFSLVVEFKQSNHHSHKERAPEELIVLLKNPSRATEKNSDRTINKVINDLYNTKYINVSKITFINVFPFYITDSRKLSIFDNEMKNKELDEKKEYKDILDKNLNKIENIINNTDVKPKIICAYGKGIGNKDNLKKIEILLQAYPSDKLKSFNTDKSVPLHPQRLPIDPDKPIKKFIINCKKDQAKK
ncbi:DUF1643 domain-containing protein [Bacillus pumilus]|uniref:DUF1643 domain-containing protein n=1 Tax=Bacillus pumilus TaxID=1408 RepID=UPI002FFF708B